MMNYTPLPRPPRRVDHRQQRGVVLFIALMVMVALSLAGIALVRSVDTATTVAGNLAFRQSTFSPMNLPVEKATYAIKNAGAVGGVNPSLNGNDAAANYSATLLGGESANSIPAMLQGTYPPPGYPGGYAVVPRDLAGNEMRYVIERVCNAAGPATPQTCDMAPPKQSFGKTDNKLWGIILGKNPFYRLTVRVDGPGNTVSYMQAMLR